MHKSPKTDYWVVLKVPNTVYQYSIMICDHRNLFLGLPTHNIHHMGQKSKFDKRLFVTTGFSYSSLIPINLHFYARDSYFLYRYPI